MGNGGTNRIWRKRNSRWKKEPIPIVEDQCVNCETTKSPVWRKNGEGNIVCNA